MLGCFEIFSGLSITYRKLKLFAIGIDEAITTEVVDFGVVALTLFH